MPSHPACAPLRHHPERYGVKQHDMFAAAGSQQRSPRVIYATWTFQVGYFMTMRRGADGVGAAGEITNVTQPFQPAGRFWLANSQ